MISIFRRRLFWAAAVVVFVLLVQNAAAQNCANTSVGFTPLNDLRQGLYKTYQGGLYPGGTNVRPATHDSAGRALSAQIKPLSSNGTVDVQNGRIVLVSIGMSNATQEFSTFKPMADTLRSKNSQLVIVDGAQGGQDAVTISNPSATYWTVVDQRLAAAGVTPQQVQAAWVKEADAGPTLSFPADAQKLQGEFAAIARILKARYPNIKIAYYSSRIYAGYAQGVSTLNPEPYAYQSGFAVRWLIEAQINGDTSLTYAGTNPRAPWLAWGPYLWADGMTPRSDGSIWQCGDFQSDGTHPSTSGQRKVAQMLLSFFQTETTATPWFLRSPITNVEGSELQGPSEFRLEQNYPNPFNPTTTIRFRIANVELRNEQWKPMIALKVFDLLGTEVATLVNSQLDAGEHSVSFNAEGLSSGIYFYRLYTPTFTQTKSMVLLK